MTTMTAQTTQVYQLFIRATPEQVWEAITKPEFTTRYFFASRIEMADGRRRAYGPNDELWGDSAILEEDPPRRLVHEWQGLYDPDLAAEETSRVTWEIEAQDGGVTKLTLVHDQLEGAPKTAESVAGGWMFVLSGLKTLLETGEPLAG
ncbi:MAG TPA: SRPBCC family protein [Gaiellaceae bacterium]|nr:SRPBCC family protein [Gaiellaceae bacterium]